MLLADLSNTPYDGNSPTSLIYIEIVNCDNAEVCSVENGTANAFKFWRLLCPYPSLVGGITR